MKDPDAIDMEQRIRLCVMAEFKKRLLTEPDPDVRTLIVDYIADLERGHLPCSVEPVGEWRTDGAP